MPRGARGDCARVPSVPVSAMNAPSMMIGWRAARFVADAPAGGTPLDLLVVDEAQDFEAEWIQALTARLGEAGRLAVLRDAGVQRFSTQMRRGE